MPKQPEIDMPSDVLEALRAGAVVDAFFDRPADQRRGYLSWIVDARARATRRKRTRLMIEALRDGESDAGEPDIDDL